MSLSRSIPVSTPIAPRQWTRSSLQTFPEAPGAKGHPPRPPMEESKCVTPHAISGRSEEHTSELQSRLHLVCRLLLEKKKTVLSDDPAQAGELPPRILRALPHL